VSSKSVVTIERHIIEAERQFPEATGAFSNIMYDIAFAAKMIAREVRRAGLADVLGYTGEVNVQGEEVKKLDEFAHEVIFKALDHTGHLCGMASEEVEDFIPIPDRFPTGKYCVLFDPLDGSSNIEANVSVGTIFSVHRKISDHPRGCMEDCLQPGYKQVAAGYVVYGSSSMLVYTTGNGVHGFTLEPSIGEFLLSHPNIRIPTPSQRIYSVNEGNYGKWLPEQQRLVDHLLYGGMFMYPADAKSPRGKLRLLYEAAPLAMIAEQAGGRASDGTRPINQIIPDSLHQRTPLYVGTTEFVQTAEEFLAGGRSDAAAPVSIEAVAAGV
jgi:fructose-1,6-bisphosphatase I